MAGDRSKIIETMRKRYLDDFKYIHKKTDRIAFFEEIGETANEVGASAWKKFADGMSAWLRTDFETALTLIEEAISLDPEFAYPWNGKGHILRDLKRYDEALAAFEKAISLDPEFSYPWNGKGNVLSGQKRYDEALAAFEKAIGLDPKSTNPWNGKGNVLGKQKRYDEALAAFEKAIALDPDKAHPWNGKGVVLSDQKHYDEALAAYEKAISLDPEASYPWTGKGRVLRIQKRYDEALASCEKAIALDPDKAHPWNGKGNVLSDQKRYDEALASFEKAISLDPEDASYSWNGKGNVLVRQKRYDEALASFEKAIALDPEDAAQWNGKSNVLKMLERYDEALASFEKTIALSPEKGGIHYNLGLLYWEQVRPHDAVDEFRLAIELGLEPALETVAESWIERAKRMIKSKASGDLREVSEQADRSSDEALVTDLYEAMKDDLPSIRKKKIKFKKQIAGSVGKSRIIGQGGVDNMLLVLRDWNSFSPIIQRDLRKQHNPGPEERRGGGYFLVWKGHGIVIDPGVDFVTQLYQKGLSIADVDTVLVTHCHLDHTRDVESLVDLNYRYNRAKGIKPHPMNIDFRELKFQLCYSAFMKYSEYLINSGCCRNPTQLVRGGAANQINDFIAVQAVPAEHYDINGRDKEAIGLVFVLKDENGPVLKVGITSDSKWIKSLPDSFSGCDVVVAHLGTIEVGEELTATAKIGEEVTDAGKAVDTEVFLETDLKNHLGTKGCFRLLQGVKPKILILGEFGEELVETRFKILQVFHQLKPDNTRFVLGGDSNLTIGLGKELSVCCSHPKCARSWTRIQLDQVRPVLGGDFLFQYICPQHGIVDE